MLTESQWLRSPVQDAPRDDSAEGVSKGAQDTAGGVASTAGGALKGVGDTVGNTVRSRRFLNADLLVWVAGECL